MKIPDTQGSDNVLFKALCERHAEMCKVFSHTSRVMILNILRRTEMTVSEIAQKLNLPFGTVSPHLLMMRRHGVLASRNEATLVYYRLANPKILKAFDLIRELLTSQLKAERIFAQRMEKAACLKK